MFDVMELRLIRYSVQKTVEALKKRRAILDPESDDAVAIANDLMLYKHIIDKIRDIPEV